MSKTLAIVNPAAGGGRCGKLAPEAIGALRDAGLEIDVIETKRAGDATDIARDAYRRGTSRFVAVGGDGTGFEIVNGVFPEALEGAVRPTLGFLPLGTGNSFLRDFTDQGARYAREALLRGMRRPCDVIRLRHREGEVFYINILSLGFVADVCTVTNARFKRLGELGYGIGVVSTVASLACRPIPYAIDGEAYVEHKLTFVSISNSRFTGGKMMMAPLADVGDGYADVVEVGELGRLALIRTFPKIFSGEHVKHAAVRSARAKAVDFRVTGPLAAMIDGEVLSVWPERLEVLQHALEVNA